MPDSLKGWRCGQPNAWKRTSIRAELLIKGSCRLVAVTAELGAGRRHSGRAGRGGQCRDGDDGEQRESSDELLHDISPYSLWIVSKPDWLLPMRLPSAKIYSRESFENSFPSITAR